MHDPIQDDDDDDGEGVDEPEALNVVPHFDVNRIFSNRSHFNV